MINKQELIYHYEWGKTHGEVVIQPRRTIVLAEAGIRYLGSALIVAGLAGFIFSFAPVVSTEVSYQWGQFMGTNVRQAADEKALVQKVNADEQEKDKARQLAQDLGVPNSYFSIYIPKINAKAQIIENVDPYDQKVYMDALSKGVAHAAGSVFPGMSGGTYLFAHSSAPAWQSAKYNTVFYLLKELEPRSETREGDDIYVFFLDRLYKYKVVEKKIVGLDDVSWLKEAKQGKERLILQTCWPPGTSLKRLIVVAEPTN